MKNDENELLKALIQNYDFKQVKVTELPTIDYVYPSNCAFGNSEIFRFDPDLRNELSAGASKVRQTLQVKILAYTFNNSILSAVDKIEPSIGLDDLLSERINSIYAYEPFLFVGLDETNFVAYVVKPIVDGRMAWFELSSATNERVKEYLQTKATEKPYVSKRKMFLEWLLKKDM